MRVVTYQGLGAEGLKEPVDRVRAAIERCDYRAASIKKLVPTPFWRARLDEKNRLLIRFIPQGAETVCLFLELIRNHAYEKSRFLRGATIDEAKIEVMPDECAPPQPPAAGPFRLRWLHPTRDRFDLLDKPVMFDDAQQEILGLPAPLVVLGPAGSGKTAVTLARLRQARGRVLYVTHSAYLAQTARGLYSDHGYVNEAQDVEFLSYREFLDTIQAPAGSEVGLADFQTWFDRNRAGARAVSPDIDAHALFEEFRGVIGARPGAVLDLEAYQALGVRQSLLPPGAAREATHALYGRYAAWLRDNRLFDLNQVAHAWRPLAEPVYDFVVVDEVQDLTNAQLDLVLATLARTGQFVLCGDAHQIVHPSFFSWAAVRDLFWRGAAGARGSTGVVSALRTNFRNGAEVTEVANTLLKIKQARFGSVDRESSFLVESASDEAGAVRLVAARAEAVADLDARSRVSARHAVIVLRDEDKAAARAHFKTPLVFSVHEAKGLEYPNVILFNLVSGARAAFAAVCQDVTASDLCGKSLEYRRGRDKADKSLELYKFYVNALYVAMTRAIETLTLVEADARHPLLALLGLKEGEGAVLEAARASSKEEWAIEARKLELQGKREQARAIRETFLRFKPVPWSAWSEAAICALAPRALERSDPSTKPKQALVDYALWHRQHRFIEDVARSTGFHAAAALTDFGKVSLRFHFERNLAPSALPRTMRTQGERLLRPYAERSFKPVLADCDLYGVDHRTPAGATPLMMAARAGNATLAGALLKRGADAGLVDEFGHTAWMSALSRAVEEPDFASQKLEPLFDLLAPPALDVQTAGRLVRLERHQAEYWVLGLMLASIKTQGSRMLERSHDWRRYDFGFFADGLLETLEALPERLWSERRRKRSYLNHVLARAEVDGSYRPARKLWRRWGTGNYLPAADMRLPGRGADGQQVWLPIAEALNLAWVSRGSSPRFRSQFDIEDAARAAPLSRARDALTPRGAGPRSSTG